MELFGIPIRLASRDEILARVRSFLSEPGFHRIATVNPEFLVLADRNPGFKLALLSADLCVADGVGIVLAGFLHGQKVTRFPGADLLLEILSIAEQDGQTVFLAIKKDGLSSYKEIHDALLKKYPRLIVTGQDIDPAEFGNWKLVIGNSTIVLCNFGTPQQEIFLEKLRTYCGETRLVVGVGGSLDYLTGKQKRAPKLFRALGLEWLWRLSLQPKRWKRIFTAVITFPFLVLGKTLKNAIIKP